MYEENYEMLQLQPNTDGDTPVFQAELPILYINYANAYVCA